MAPILPRSTKDSNLNKSDKVAVVVDTFAEARQRDVLNLAEDSQNYLARAAHSKQPSRDDS